MPATQIQTRARNHTRTIISACLIAVAMSGLSTSTLAGWQGTGSTDSGKIPSTETTGQTEEASANTTSQPETSNAQEGTKAPPPKTSQTTNTTPKIDPQSEATPRIEPKAVTPVSKPQFVRTELLKGDFSKTWKLVAAEEGVKVKDVWQVTQTDAGRILVCTGKPKGYLRTILPHENYVLSFEFRYPMDENGNSGVLLHIDGKDKVWPDGIQVQLHRPTAGSIFPSGNRKARFTIGAKLALSLKVWNKCRITVREDTIEVSLNDVAVGPMRYCKPAAGFFALQSEGSEVHFRNIVLTKEVTAPPVVPSVVQQSPNATAAKTAPADPAAESKPASVPAKAGTKEDEGTEPTDG